MAGICRRGGLLLLTLICAGCVAPQPAPQIAKAPPEQPSDASSGEPADCLSFGVNISLLGAPGDSPLVPVSIRDRPAAMFFSPGFAPFLLRSNGPFWFPRLQDAGLVTQDGGTVRAWTTVVRDVAIGDLPPQDEAGLTLADFDTRTVKGRPIVGIIGRGILAPNAVIDLDIPRRRVTLAILRKPRCPHYETLLDAMPIDMQREVLLVPVLVNGHKVDALLDPDLPVSVIPRAMAASLGIGAADLAHDPSVRTLYGERVRGVRHRVASLVVGSTHLQNVAFDVESDVDYVMLGLNFFAHGEAVFDFEQGRFWFRTQTDTLPRPGALHFDDSKVAHTDVQ